MSHQRIISVASAALLIFTSTAMAQSAATQQPPESQLYVGGLQPPATPDTHSDRPSDNDFHTDKPGVRVGTTYYQRDIGRWKDPLTLPHTKTDCVTWASGDWPWGGGWKTCTGWRTQTQWLYNTATMTITAPNVADIQSATNECLNQAAIIAAAAALVGGGSAAVPAFVAVMKPCLVAKLNEDLGVNVNIHSNWGGWE